MGTLNVSLRLKSRKIIKEHIVSKKNIVYKQSQKKRTEMNQPLLITIYKSPNL